MHTLKKLARSAWEFILGLPHKLSNYFKDYFKNLNYFYWVPMVIVSIGLLLLDIFTKIAAQNFNQTCYNYGQGFAGNPPFPVGGWDGTIIPGLIEFGYAENSGAAFSWMSGWTWPLVILSSIAVVFLFINLIFRFNKINVWVNIAVTLMLPGALGNLIDRIGFLSYQITGISNIYQNGVIDFLVFSFWRNFAVCNVADYCLSVGAVFLIVGVIVQFVQEYKKLKQEEEEEKLKLQSGESIQENTDMRNKLKELEENKENNSKEDSTIDNDSIDDSISSEPSKCEEDSNNVENINDNKDSD